MKQLTFIEKTSSAIFTILNILVFAYIFWINGGPGVTLANTNLLFFFMSLPIILAFLAIMTLTIIKENVPPIAEQKKSFWLRFAIAGCFLFVVNVCYLFFYISSNNLPSPDRTSITPIAYLFNHPILIFIIGIAAITFSIKDYFSEE
jgi:hypothetical protein